MALSWPDADRIQQWLEQGKVEHYICDQCHGLHFSWLQEREGVLDSRLFVEADWLLLTTELELRPAALFTVLSDTPRLSMDYPAVKIFADVNDETMPRLVVCNVLHTRAGLTFEQFVHFVDVTLDATAQLHQECERLDYLFWPEEEGDEQAGPGAALH